MGSRSWCLISVSTGSVGCKRGSLTDRCSTFGSGREAISAFSKEGCHSLFQSSGKLSGGGGMSSQPLEEGEIYVELLCSATCRMGGGMFGSMRILFCGAPLCVGG